MRLILDVLPVEPIDEHVILAIDPHLPESDDTAELGDAIDGSCDDDTLPTAVVCTAADWVVRDSEGSHDVRIRIAIVYVEGNSSILMQKYE